LSFSRSPFGGSGTGGKESASAMAHDSAIRSHDKNRASRDDRPKALGGQWVTYVAGAYGDGSLHRFTCFVFLV
jgi:hypothetical protein